MSCESDLEYFQSALESKANWTLGLLTSWLQFTSHPSPESLTRFGPFSECMNFRRYRAFNSSQVVVRGQHCLISYSSILWHDFDETSAAATAAVIGDDSFVERDVMIFKNGICLPASCSSPQQTLGFVKALLSETNFVVLDIFCQRQEEVPLHFIDFVLLFLFTLLIFMALTATFFETRTRHSKVFHAFSLTRNFKSLMSQNDELDCLNGLKVISAIWIIVGHRMDMMIEHPQQMSLFMSAEEKIVLRAAERFTSIVDTFFVVSGVLTARKCMTLFNGHKFCYLRHCLTRFARFVPSLAVIFLFFMSSLPKLLANGPQTKELVDELNDCRKSWLGSLLLLHNFSDNICLRHTWYTSVDFQLFILSPPIIYGLFRYGRKFLGIIAFIILLGQINIYYVLSKNSAAPGETAEEEEGDEKFYYETQFRFMPWLTGISLGYIMQITEGRNSLSKQSRVLGWTVSLASLIGLEFLLAARLHHRSPLFAASHRVIYSAAIAWIIYACQHLRSGGIVRALLSHRVWRPISKMCLSIYLVHYLTVLLAFVGMKQPYQFGFLWLVKILAIDVTNSLVYSFVFFMLVESPLMNITRAFVGL